jgi:hypothetical protein
MLAAAVVFTAATAYGSTVSIRLDLEGEPFGIRVPIPVPAAVALGWGAALSAPWPMPAAALLAAHRAGRSTSPAPGLVHIALGTVVLVVGLLGEPVVRTFRTQPRTVRAAITGNVLAATALVVSGLRQARSRPQVVTSISRRVSSHS